MSIKNIRKQDPEIADLLEKEINRQREGLVMIPSENFASPAVMEATGSVCTNKYAEGYPGKRYYTGAKYIDMIENLAIERAKELFEAEHANVQPNSGSTANAEIYSALIKPGDKVLGMNLAHGGHLTHGSPVNFSGKTYNFIPYGVSEKDEIVDMDEVREIALKERPKIILSGTTAYPRKVEFKKFAEIAKEVNAYAFADMSHISGLCISGAHENPVPSQDVVMTTTTKTLRGPRSAVILSKKKDQYHDLYHPEEKRDLAGLIDFAVFPGMQGGPLEHVIAAKAVAFKEAMTEEYKEYQRQIVKNAKALAQELMDQGLKLVSNGTDTHLMLIDCTDLGITGKEGANKLEELGIYSNMNMIPFDKRTPFNPSGIRLGTPALTSRGMREEEMKKIGKAIADVLKDLNDTDAGERAKKIVKEVTEQFPLYPNISYA